MKKILIKVIDCLIKFKNKIILIYFAVFDFFYRHIFPAPEVAGSLETISTVAENCASIARFGDGEIKLAAGMDISFQKATDFSVNKLREVLSCDVNGLLIGIVDIFGDNEAFDETTRKYWRGHVRRFRRVWYRYLKKGKKYYDASMSRPYISYKDKSQSAEVFESLKKIWDGRDIVFIEGEKSRMGVGNTLFSNARSIRRIIGPSFQAFSKYNEILNEAMKVEKDALILLALGPCATALAYDLHCAGYQAVDIGHADIEYEWFLMNAEKKVPVKNKLVHEARNGAENAEFRDSEYEKQIIAKII